MRARAASDAARRLGDSNATAAYGHRRESSQSVSSSAAAPREVAEKPVLPDPEAARDERRLDRARPGEHGHVDPRRERRLDEAAARVVDARQPRVGDEGKRLARLQPRQQLARLARLVVTVDADERRAHGSRSGRGAPACDACPRRARGRRPGARPARGASRLRGSRSASRRPEAASTATEPVERLEADEPGADEPRVVTEGRLDDPQLVVGRVQRLAAGGLLGGAGRGSPTPPCRNHLRRRRPPGRRCSRRSRSRRRGSARSARAPNARPRGRPALRARAGGRRRLAPQLDRRALRCLAGRDGLEVPVAVAAPLARRPVGRDDDVTELGPAAVEPIRR